MICCTIAINTNTSQSTRMLHRIGLIIQKGMEPDLCHLVELYVSNHVCG